jgi:GcrA cell cycle regulator
MIDDRPLRPDAFALQTGRKGKALVDLEPGDCRWPLGDPLEPGFQFCADAAHAGTAYCARHHAIAHPAAAARRRRQKRQAEAEVVHARHDALETA